MSMLSHRRSARRLVVAPFLAALLGLAGASPASGEDAKNITPFPDCSGMWLDGAALRLQVDVYAGLLARREATVRTDLPAEPSLAGTALPQAAVYECLPGDQSGSEPKLIPVGSVIARSEEGAVQAMWALSGQTLPLGQRRYHIYLAPSNAEPLPGAAQPGTPVRLPGENLLPNPGFERVDPKDPRNPEGWYVTGIVREGSAVASGVRVPEAARSGQFGFSSSLEAGDGTPAEISGGQASLAEPIRVRPGVRYVVDAWVRVDAATGAGANISAPFLDAKGEPLGPRIHVFTSSGRTTDGWTQLRGWAVAPPDAHFLRLTLGNWRSRGKTAFDDVSLYIDPIGAGPPPRVVPHSPEDKATYRKSLQLPRGGEAWLFDFGPTDSPAGGGFIPIDPSIRFDTNGMYGFCADGPLRSARGPRPDAIAQDWVDFSDSAFCLRMPDGPVVVWMLLGDYTTPPPAEWSPPAFYTTPVAIQAGPVALRAENPLIDFGALHLEPEDDAVAQLKSGAFAVHERYVAPRFTPLLVESEVRNGVIELRCQPSGACPVTAMGVFRGTSRAAVQEELAYLDALRRWSFTVAWAQAVEAETHRAPFGPTPDEQNVGFTAFAIDTNSDVYPHTIPSREQVDALRQGLSVRVTRGETTSASIGLYPLVFRRSLAIDVEPPVNHIGEGIGADAIQVNHVRYRFRRLLERVDDPRFALRPEEVVPAEGLSVRPGLTRRLWLTIRAAESAAAGTYVGKLRLDAGQGRTLEIPISIQILPFTLEASAIHQGVLSGEWYPGGDRAAMYRDMAEHGMDVLYLPGAPRARQEGSRVAGDFSRWDETLAAAQAGGFTAAALVSQLSGEAAFDLVGEPRVDPSYSGSPSHRGKRSFSPAFDSAYKSLLSQATQYTRAKGWPPLVHYVSGEGASEGELGLAYEKHMLELCRASSAEALCAASINGPASLEHLSLMDAVLPNYGVGLDAPVFARMHETPKGKLRRSVWLYNTGGDRYGRGLYAWAAGVDAVVHEMYAFRSGAGDPFDPWDSDEGFTSYVRPGGRGPVPLLRWEQARLGANDARLLSHVESRIIDARAKGMATADAVVRAERFLHELRSRIDLTVTPADIGWDYRLNARRFPRGPDFDLLRSGLLELASALEALR